MVEILQIEKPHKLKLHYSIQGKGIPLLFLNGASASHTHYQDLLDELAKFFKVYAFTLPGFGKSTRLKKLSVENYLEVVNQFVDQMNLKDFVLVGHSFGGGLALAYSFKYQDKIKSVAG